MNLRLKKRSCQTSVFPMVRLRRFWVVAKKPILSLTLCALLIFGLSDVSLAKEDAEALSLYATAAVLMDGETGRVLYGKQEDLPLPNASTTKVMTCILILEGCDLEEELAVSGYAESMPKVKLGIRKGEAYRVRDLLYSLMLESHNDVAVSLAEHLGKKEDPALMTREEREFTKEESLLAVKFFARRMNEKAREIGCEDTFFLTPNGLDGTESIKETDGTVRTMEHHTTASDLARILAYCIQSSSKREEFLMITRAASHSFTANGRSFALYNHNAFLNMMDGALTGKTGFTGKAGYCYVGAVLREEKLLIVALLACGWPNNRSYKWKDAKNLIEFGLERFQREDLQDLERFVPKDSLPMVRVIGGKGSHIGEEVTIQLEIAGRSEKSGQGEGRPKGVLLGSGEKVIPRMELPEECSAPVKRGQKLGEIAYYVNGEVLMREELVADRDVEKIDFRWCMWQSCKALLMTWA